MGATAPRQAQPLQHTTVVDAVPARDTATPDIAIRLPAAAPDAGVSIDPGMVSGSGGMTADAAGASQSRQSQPAAATTFTASPDTVDPTLRAAPAAVAVRVVRAGDRQDLIIQLRPAELGQMQVRIERQADATTRVVVAVERPETLALLQHDQTQLHQALDAAGVPAEHRSIAMHVTDRRAGEPDGPALGAGESGRGQQNGGQDQRQGGSRPHDPGTTADNPSSEPRPAAQRWRALGVDITA